MKIPITYGMIQSPIRIDLSKFSAIPNLSPDIAAIVSVASREFNFGERDFTSKSRRQPLAWVRQMVMWLCYSRRLGSNKKIGMAFGGRTTKAVIYARQTVLERMEVDAKAREQVRKLEAAIQRG